MQAMSQSDDCPSDAPCGTHKSDYRWSKRYGYMIRHNGLVCVCHPRRLPQPKESSQEMFVVNEPPEQKESNTLKRSYNSDDSPVSYESFDCPSDAPCGAYESDYTYSKRYGYMIRHKGMLCVCHPRRLPLCPMEAPCGVDFGDQKSRGFYLIYEGSYCFCSPRLHRPRQQPKRDLFVMNEPNRSDFPRPQPLNNQRPLKKGREYELGSRGKCPPEAPCYVDRQPDGFYLAFNGGVCYCPPR
ncbi:hypothetical protein DdX_21110 [Ditylenchus destructor]|uniref:Uncharacterized protein n=1 Tax=Ditylenchus destructor TaxID=166010 RepID=A0AAD4MGZ9_9BILA|nr:hypothetical protein DdX_21110 [Ditylenchus destructor]